MKRQKTEIVNGRRLIHSSGYPKELELKDRRKRGEQKIRPDERDLGISEDQMLQV